MSRSLLCVLVVMLVRPGETDAGESGRSRPAALVVRTHVAVRYNDGGKGPERIVIRLSDPSGVLPKPRVDPPPPPPPGKVAIPRAFPPDPEIEGRDGVVEARLPVEGEFEVLAVVADGYEHRFPNLRLDFRDGGKLLVLLDRPRPITLRVVDAHSGQPLPSARFYRQKYGRYGAPFGKHSIFPNAPTLVDAEPQLADRDGRIRLEAGTDVLRSYLIADGHAWRPLRVLPTIGGEAVVPLLPGGEVRIHVPAWATLASPILRASCGNPAFVTRVPPPGPSGEAVLSGVPAGRVRFDVVHKLRPQICYGGGVVNVVPGGTEALAIATVPRARGPAVSVEGTLRVPRAWGRWESGTVTAYLRGTGPELVGSYATPNCEVDGSDTPAPFRTTPLLAGSYDFAVPAFGWHTTVGVELGRKLDLVVPEPRVAVLRFVDNESGRDVQVGADWLWCDVPDGRILPTIETSLDDAGHHVVRTASDRINVRAVAPDYAYVLATVDLERGRVNRVTLGMLPGASLRVRLRLEGRPFGGEGIASSMSLGDVDRGPATWRAIWTPRFVSARFCQGVAGYEGLEPGTWTLALSDVAGIAPVRREVELRPGQTAELDLDLKRTGR